MDPYTHMDLQPILFRTRLATTSNKDRRKYKKLTTVTSQPLPQAPYLGRIPWDTEHRGTEVLSS